MEDNEQSGKGVDEDIAATILTSLDLLTTETCMAPTCNENIIAVRQLLLRSAGNLSMDLISDKRRF